MKRTGYGIVVWLCIVAAQAAAQSTFDFAIHPEQERGSISPLIYGANVLHNFPLEAVDNTYPFIPSRRFGGDRVTGYNWENNFSNGGSYVCDPAHPKDADYCNPNDDALPYFHRVEPADYKSPGAVLRAFHDVSLANGSFSLVQLPMAGYVAGDGDGPVTQAQSAPSSRWVRVVNRKDGALTLSPDVNDGVVYVDEELYFLTQTYGRASSARGVKAYELDNEPDIWYADGNDGGTHPRLFPHKLGAARFLEMTLGLARKIKSTYTDAEVFGPAFANYAGFVNLHNAYDWDQVNGGAARFVEWYLAQLKTASDQSGRRLLDAFTFHWYSQEDGVDSDDESVATVTRRLQAPRSLWDGTYVEDSWITRDVLGGKPIRQIPDLQEVIDANYPGTKIGITEWRFGAKNHVSGGLAVADGLGIFGKYNVYFATFFDNLTGYALAAFDLYRNFSGQSALFGNRRIPSETSDVFASSVYASMNETKDEVHVIVINKRGKEIIARISMSGGARYLPAAEVFGFQSTSPKVAHLGTATVLPDNTCSWTMAPYSAVHIVVRSDGGLGAMAATDPSLVELSQNTPNPAAGGTRITFRTQAYGRVTLTLRDALGRIVEQPVNGEFGPGEHVMEIPTSGLLPGAYYYTLTSAGGMTTRKMIVAR